MVFANVSGSATILTSVGLAHAVCVTSKHVFTEAYTRICLQSERPVPQIQLT